MCTLEAEWISKGRMFYLSTILWKKLFLSTFVLADLFFNDLFRNVEASSGPLGNKNPKIEKSPHRYNHWGP